MPTDKETPRIMLYIAKITEEDDRWLAEFPDCSGCQTFGDTRAEAIEMAHEALEGWLETGMEHGDVPPRPMPHRGVEIEVRPALAVAIQLRWLRDERGLTQTQLAKEIGVSQQQIAKLEKVDANPTINTLTDIAKKIGAVLSISLAGAAIGAAVGRAQRKVGAKPVAKAKAKLRAV